MVPKNQKNDLQNYIIGILNTSKAVGLIFKVFVQLVYLMTNFKWSLPSLDIHLLWRSACVVLYLWNSFLSNTAILILMEKETGNTCFQLSTNFWFVFFCFFFLFCFVAFVFNFSMCIELFESSEMCNPNKRSAASAPGAWGTPFLEIPLTTVVRQTQQNPWA